VKPLQHFPGPLAAVGLSFAAWLAAAVTITVLRNATGSGIGIATLGVGEALGIGAVAAVAARRVPPPQPERIGLRGFSPLLLPSLLLLLPLTVVVSELMNVAHTLFPPPDAQEVVRRTVERLDTGTALSALETAIVVVGIAPLVEEWLYRGVIQQGAVARLGKVGGVLLTACLFGLGHLEPSLSAASTLAGFAANLPLGIALGCVRLATGSVFASMAVHAGYNGLGLLALALAVRFPVPGFNAPGAHTPTEVLAPCSLAVALGFALVLRGARAAPRALPIPRVAQGDG
jgi:membrane protease YdiL (CAAX protease family)